MNQMRKTIREAILEELDAMGLPENEAELNITGRDGMQDTISDDLKQEMINNGLAAIESLGAEIEPKFLEAIRKAYIEAKTEASTKPLVSFYKYALSVPQVRDADYFPDPETYASLAKALAFSDDGELSDKMQKIMLHTGRFVDGLTRVYDRGMTKAISQDVRSDVTPVEDTGLAGAQIADPTPSYSLEDYDLVNESFQDDSEPSDGPLFDPHVHDQPDNTSALSGRELYIYDAIVKRYPYLADYPMDVYRNAFQRVGQTGMTNMHAVAREMEMLHDDGWYDSPELSPAIPDDHPSLASGPAKDQHPLDDDGDGNVDWDEISEQKTLELDRFTWGQAKSAPQPGVKTDGELTESRGSLIRKRYYGRY